MRLTQLLARQLVAYQQIDPSPVRLEIEAVRIWAENVPEEDLEPPDRDFIPCEVPAFARKYISCPAANVKVAIPTHPLFVKSIVFPPHLAPILMTTLGNVKADDVPSLEYLLKTAHSYLQDPNHFTLAESAVNDPRVEPRLREQIRRGAITLITECTSAYSPVYPDIEDGNLARMVDPNMRFEAQDHLSRNFEYKKGQDQLPLPPDHQEFCLERFWALRYDPCSAYNALNLSAFGDGDKAPFLKRLSDCRRVMQFHPTAAVPWDAVRSHSWYLMAHGMTFTRSHHDGSGFATFVEILYGVKIWCYFRWLNPPPTAQQLHRHYELLTRNDVMQLEYSECPTWYDPKTGKFDEAVWFRDREEWKRYQIGQWHVLKLSPGMTILQPPNVTHAVYNPTSSMCDGGHDLHWDGLVHTRNGARADAMFTSPITNDSHLIVHYMLLQMALSLRSPDQGPAEPEPTSRGHRRLEIAALARMIYFPQRYMSYMITDVEREERQIISNPSFTSLEKEALAVIVRVLEAESICAFGVYNPVGRREVHRKEWRGITKAKKKEKVTQMLEHDFEDEPLM